VETTRRARLEARITVKEAQLALLDASYASIAGMTAAEYEIDTAGDTQRVRRVTLKSLDDQIKKLEDDIERLYNLLRSGGIVRLRTIRYPG